MTLSSKLTEDLKENTRKLTRKINAMDEDLKRQIEDIAQKEIETLFKMKGSDDGTEKV